MWENFAILLDRYCCVRYYYKILAYLQLCTVAYKFIMWFTEVYMRVYESKIDMYYHLGLLNNIYVVAKRFYSNIIGDDDYYISFISRLKYPEYSRLPSNCVHINNYIPYRTVMHWCATISSNTPTPLIEQHNFLKISQTFYIIYVVRGGYIFNTLRK